MQITRTVQENSSGGKQQKMHVFYKRLILGASCPGGGRPSGSCSGDSFPLELFAVPVAQVPVVRTPSCSINQFVF